MADQIVALLKISWIARVTCDYGTFLADTKRGKTLKPTVPHSNSTFRSQRASENRLFVFLFSNVLDFSIVNRFLRTETMNGESRKRDRRDFRGSKKQKNLIRTAEEELEAKLGFDIFSEGDKRLGWLLTLASVSCFY